MAEPLRVTILGAGIGAQHFDAYRALPGRFTPVALCDLDRARAAAVAGDIATDDPEALLARDDIDIVDICLPPHLHVLWSLKALEAGKHVVCEKPIATSLADMDRLEVAATRAGRVLFPVFQYRYGPEMARLRAVMAAGLAGKPLVASIETHWRRDTAYYANPWRGTWAGEQGGAIVGHAIHAHDLLTTVFGPVAEVSAFLETRVNPIETEDCAAIAFRMTSGALATSSVTLGAADDTTRLRFVFEKLTVESARVPYAPASVTWTFRARGTEADQAALDAILSGVPDAPIGFAGFVTAVADALQSAGAEAVTLADGRRSIELVTAIYDAAQGGRVVSLPLGADHALYAGWVPEDGRDTR